MPTRRLTRDPHGRMQFTQLSLDDDEDNNERNRSLLDDDKVNNEQTRIVQNDDVDEAILPRGLPNGNGMNHMADPPFTSDDIPTSDDQEYLPLIIRGYSESEPSARPSSDADSDNVQQVHLDVDQGEYVNANALPDTLPLSQMPNLTNAQSVLSDENEKHEEHDGHDTCQIGDEDMHSEIVVSDDISFSEDDSDDFVRSEGDESYHPSEPEAGNARKRRAKTVAQKNTAKNRRLVGKPNSVASKRAIPQNTKNANKTAPGSSDENLPYINDVEESLYDYEAVQVADGGIVSPPQPEAVNQTKKSVLPSTKRVAKPSFLDAPERLSSEAKPAAKTAMEAENKASRVKTRPTGPKERSQAHCADKLPTMQAEPKGLGSDQVDWYDIEGSLEPTVANASPKPESNAVPLPKKKTAPGHGCQPPKAKGRGRPGLAHPPPQPPAVDPLGNDGLLEPEGYPMLKKRETEPQIVAKKDTSAERAARMHGRAKGEVRDIEDMQEALDAPKSKRNANRGTTGPNSKKKRVYESNARNQRPSNKPAPKEIEPEYRIVHFESHTGAVGHPQPDVEKDVTLAPLQNPGTKSKDVDSDISMDDLQDIGIPEEISAKPTRKSRARKGRLAEADTLAPAVKKQKVSLKVIKPVVTIEDDTSSQVSDDSSLNVESKTISHPIDVRSRPVSAFDVNEKQLRAEATQRTPVGEIMPLMLDRNEVSRRDQVHHTSPPKITAKSRYFLRDCHDVPSNQEQASRLRRCHHSNDDVFASDNDSPRLQNTSFMDKLYDASAAHQQPEYKAPIHPRPQMVAEELSKSQLLSYDHCGHGQKQKLSTGRFTGEDERFERSKPFAIVHAKSQVFSQEILKNESSRRKDHRSECDRRQGDAYSQGMTDQRGSDSASASAGRQHHESRWKAAVDTATGEVQEKMHAVTQIVLRGLNLKEVTINMVAEEYRRNGKNIGKRLLRRQYQERKVVHASFNTDCNQLVTIYDRASQVVESIGDKLSPIDTKVSQERKNHLLQSRNLVSDIRAARDGLVKV